MAKQFSLPAEANIVQALNPAADAAGRAGAYVSLKNAHKAYVIFHVTQGNATTVQCSINQAQDVSGAGAKAIGATPIWSNLDQSTGDALTSRPPAANYTTDAALKNKIVVFEIVPEAVMDTGNGFRTIAAVTGASNAANITQALFVVIPARYQQATPPSLLTN
jgi:hypothetical protein